MHQRAARRHVGHRQHEHRSGKHGADPETACHVHEFRIRRIGVGAKIRNHRLQRHAALRARAGLVARPPPGPWDRCISWLVARGSWLVARGSWLVARGSWLVARGSWPAAGPGGSRLRSACRSDRPIEAADLDGRRHRLALGREELLGLGGELRDAAFGAEVVGRPAVFDVAGGAFRIDHHPADGVEARRAATLALRCWRRTRCWPVSSSAVVKRGSMSTGTARQLVERALDGRPHDARAGRASATGFRVVAFAPGSS